MLLRMIARVAILVALSLRREDDTPVVTQACWYAEEVGRFVKCVSSSESAAVRTWLDAGERRFPSLEALRLWLRDVLGPCYAQPSAGADDAPEAPLTDFRAIREGITRFDRPSFVDAAQLEATLAKSVRGQSDALRTLAHHVTRHLARRKPKRPMTIFAVGPSGVGKTQTALALHEALKSVSAGPRTLPFVRIDMAEYQEAHRISQLLSNFKHFGALTPRL